MSLASRYWASLTGRVAAPAPPQRGQTGYSLRRRYVAALLGITLSPTTSVAPQPSPAVSQTTPRPARFGRGWALAAGMAVGGLAVFSVVFVAGSGGSPVGGMAPPSFTESVPTGADGPERFSFRPRDTNEVSMCVTLTGEGTVPRQGAAVLMVHDSGESGDFAHFGARLTFYGDHWRADIVLGGREDAGKRFALYIFAVSPEIAEQLASRGTMMAGEIPGEQLLDAMGVTRTGGTGNC